MECLVHNLARNVLWYTKEYARSPYDWNSLTDYATLLRSREPAVNVVPLIGLAPIVWKAGYRPTKETDARKMTAQEMEKAKDLMRQGFEQGAFGLSSTRDYNPNQYVDPSDVVELLKVAAEYRRTWFPHTTHVCTPEGVKEGIEWALEAGVKLHIAHFNVIPNFYPGNTNTIYNCLGEIDTAREQGFDVTFDVMTWFNYCYPPGTLIHTLRHMCKVYPDTPLRGTESVEEFRKAGMDPDYRDKVKYTIEEYIHRAAIRYGFLHREHLDSVLLVNTGDERLEGKTLGQIAKERGENPKDLYYEIGFGVSPILNTSPDTVVIWPLTTSHPYEENVVQALSHRLATPSIDTPTYAVNAKEHFNSSTYGAFPRGFRLMVDHGIRMEESIRKMTSYPARILGLSDRGIIGEGMKADLLLIDPVEFGPGNNLINATEKAHGISYVMVNGRLVMDNGELTKERPGGVLLRKSKTA
jgi:N-acyl-D-amino-acid deacylase